MLGSMNRSARIFGSGLIIAASFLLGCLDSPETFRPDVGFIPNEIPMAVDDEFTVMINSTTIFEVATNDSDVDGDELFIANFTDPSNGSLNYGDSASLVYTAGSQAGTDEFQYTIEDGRGGTADATVRVTIIAQNNLPVAVADSLATQQGQTATIRAIANDSDSDGDALSIVAVDAINSGTVMFDAQTITYTPNPDFFGSEKFAYTITDGRGLRASAYVTVSVNGRPVLVDDIYPVSITGPTQIDVLSNDRDPDQDNFGIISVTQPRQGLVEISSDQLVYTPPAGFRGNQGFSYTVEDARGGTATASVTVRVSSPPIAVADSILAQEDTALEVMVLANDTDPEMDTLAITGITQPSNGQVRGLSEATILYTPNSGFIGADQFFYTISDGNLNTATGTVSLTVNGRPDLTDDDVYTAVNAPLTIPVLANDTDPDGDLFTVVAIQTPPSGTATITPAGDVQFVPVNNFSGSVAFTYTVEDTRGGRATGQINVTVNTVPTTGDDVAETQQDIPVTIDVLANDSDADNDRLVVLTTQPGANGRVDINPNNTLTYTPNAGFYGQDNFIYTVSDGRQGTTNANVVVTVNSRPIALDDSATTLQATPVVLDVLANDTDPEDSFQIESFSLVFTGTVTNDSGQTLTYSPNPEFFGTETISYTIVDARGGRDSAVVTVVVNGQTTAVADTAFTQRNVAVEIDVLANDLDPENDPLSIDSFQQPGNGNVTTSAGGLRYTPNNNFTGNDSFSYTITDGGSNSTAQVTIRVNAIPVAVTDTFITQQDTDALLDVLANDTDQGPPPDTLRITPGSLTVPTNGTVTSTGNDVVRFVPPNGFFGSSTFQYAVEDNFGGSAVGTVNVTVNGRPTATADNALTQMGQPFTVSVLGNDTDPDADTLSVSSVTQGLNGTVTILGSTQVQYTSNPTYFGPDTFTYTVSDGRGGFDTADVVIAVNAPPVVNNDVFNVLQDTTAILDVLANDDSPDLDLLTFVSVLGASNGTIVENNNALEYTPNAAFVGTDTFTYTMRDDNGGEDTGTVNITIVPRETFTQRTESLTGVADTQSLTIADLDSDGLFDVISVNSNANTITILPSQAPDWADRVEINVGTSPQDVAAADFNNDGLSDLAIVNSGSNNVTVLLNTSAAPGLFTFSSTTFNLASAPDSVAAADINQDNLPDLVVASSSGNQLLVLVNGTGTAASTPVFAAPVTIAAANALDVIIVDLNQDNANDLVSLNSAAGEVMTFLNDTSGTTGQAAAFGAANNFAVGTNPVSVQAGDLNRDNAPDLAVVNSGSDDLSILLNTTAAAATTVTFGAQNLINATAGSSPSDLIFSDINQDTVPDLLYLSEDLDQMVALMNQTVAAATAPTFGAPFTISTGDGPTAMAEIFIDADFFPDVVVINSRTDLLTSYLNQTGMAGAVPAYTLSQDGRMGRSRPVDVEIADLTRDGEIDVVSLDQVDRTISVFANVSTTGVSPVAISERTTFSFTPSNATDLVLGDLNQDGLSDVLVLDPSQTSFYYRVNTTAASGTAATFAPEASFTTGSNSVSAAIADLDADGVNDLAIVEQTANQVVIHRNQTVASSATLSFAAPQSLVTGLSPTAVTIADLNGDARPDIVVTNGNQNSVSVFVNQTATAGAITFQTIGPFNASVAPSAVLVLDMDNDNILDIVTLNQTDDSIAIIRGTTPNPTAPVTFDVVQVQNVLPPASSLSKVVSGDVNGDGRPDLIVATDSDNSVSVFYNLTVAGETNVVFGGASYAAGTLPVSAVAADLNTDGNLDLITVNAESDDLVILNGF